ncbi:hypothetical protein A0J61_08847 [Choanephora cucurbitarum]|uniref:HECT-type E3 ubiquitin transferase n=1 Tax=Choanephora cucurbitarum TaxID=101091 RepID=A0A1C7N704_9FUNG|nr:hypothetical protein A0J61_08847 [Choanephora cucurbitarum]
MNFSFEGNYKPKRSINLGGVRRVDDKKSLMAKAQLERKQREQERLRLKSAGRIQRKKAFYRGRKIAAEVRENNRREFSERMTREPIDLLSMTRLLLSFYQPEKDAQYLNYLANTFSNSYAWNSDSGIWLLCLLIKKVLLPSLASTEATQLLAYAFTHLDNPETHSRILTYALYHTNLLNDLKETQKPYSDTIESIFYQCIAFNPPYDYTPSGLIQQYGSTCKHTPYMTRPVLLDKITRELLTDPFFFDQFKDHDKTRQIWATQLPLEDTLSTVIGLFPDPKLESTDLAGLLINITGMGETDSGKRLAASLTNNSDDSSDDEEDIVMQEIQEPAVLVSPLIRARLELLYAPDRINDLLYTFIQRKSDTESIASFFNTLMMRWPAKKDSVLNTLLYKSRQRAAYPLVQRLWQSWSPLASVFDDQNIIPHLSIAVKSLTDNSSHWSILYLLCEVYARLLLTMGDDEFFSEGNALRVDQIVTLSRQLKNIAFVMFWRAGSMDLTQAIGMTGIQLSQLRSSVTHLLQQIHMRDSRRAFCPKSHWLIPDLDTDDFSSEAVAEEFNLESEEQQLFEIDPSAKSRSVSKGRLAIISPRLGLLNNIPFVIPFEQRVEIFRMFVANDKKRNQIDDMYHRPKASAIVRRDHMFEDGYNSLSRLGATELKGKVAISFVDEFGLEEAGIDGGGVFKEFLTGLSKEAFNLDYGLFVATPDQLLYPNPSLSASHPQQLEYFRFLGLIIGKAVYEGVLLDVAFAEFFLKKCLGKVNYLDDLVSLDPDLYKGLIAIKHYEGNVEDLSLDFTSSHSEYGEPVIMDVIPNGSQIPVTNANRIQYIYSIANYKLNVQIAKQCRAFFRGLSTIIDIKWLRMFNQQELQVLLGGASVPINLTDLRTHTVLAGYRDHDLTVQYFWRALESFDNELRMKFVKFVTSCSRPPLLGFKELVPQFCLRNAGTDDERLPTSSTCVNLLKLPSYTSYEILREKLLYAINADAGFDLS